MIKVLRFFEPLPQLILDGKKDTTWRINDDKNLEKDDVLSLVDRERNEFAKAQVLWTKYTTFGKLSPEDTEGHETFTDIEELLKTYSEYYSTNATLETPVKVIKFKLI
jgi:hypothetical protein